MTAVKKLSMQDHKDLLHVIGKSQPGIPHQLDFSDEIQYRFFMKDLEDAGVIEKDFPQVYKTIARAKEAHIAPNGPVLPGTGTPSQQGLENVNIITTAVYNTSPANLAAANTPVATGQCSASAVSTVVGGTIFTTLVLKIIDIATGNVLVSKQIGPVFGEGEYLPILTEGTAPGAQGMKVVFTYSYQQKEGQPPVFETVHLDLNDEPVGIPTVTQPVLTPEHLAQGQKYIKFGIGRPQPGYNPDCDYVWSESTQDHPIVRLPMVGSQKFKSNIVGPLKEENITCYLMLVNKGGAGAPIKPTGGLLSGIQISPNDPKLLTWNFPYNGDIKLDKSIQFGPATFAPDSLTALFFQVILNVEGSTDPVQTCIYGTTSPYWSPSSYDQPGIYVIRPFDYVWHCVAEDTEVTLIDKSTKRIDQLTGGEALLGIDGKTVRVLDTVFGQEEKPLLAITNDQGESIKVTNNHFIMTDKGPQKADKLSEGDALITVTGTSKIKSITREVFNRRVWNIGLINTDAEPAEDHYFFGNGMLIGDRHAASHFALNHEKTLEDVLQALPVEWHKDAISAFERKQLEV